MGFGVWGLGFGVWGLRGWVACYLGLGVKFSASLTIQSYLKLVMGCTLLKGKGRHTVLEPNGPLP